MIGTDNTARKQVEEEQKKLDQRLRDQQFYTRSLIESNIDALMTTDPRGIITDVNKQMEALTGCTRDELIGAPFKNYFTDPERAEAAIKLVLSEKKVSDYELTACARDGKKTEVSYNATTFYDRDRTLQGVFAAARDVTERKRNEQALLETNAELETAKSAAEKANLAKSDFLSSMSHELRSPLNAILGFAQLMESAAPEPTDSQKESIAQILQAGWHLLELINQVLDLAVIESGKVSHLAASRCPWREVMSECQAMMEPEAQQRGVTMTFPGFDKRGLRQRRPDPPQADCHQPALQRDQVQQAAGNGRRGVRHEQPGAHAHQRQRHRRGIVAGKAGAAVPAVQPARAGSGGRGRHGHRTGGHQATGRADGGRARRGQHRRQRKRVLVRSAFERRAARRRSNIASAAAPDEAPASTAARMRTVLYVEDNPANMTLVEQLIARRPDIRLLTAVNGTLGIEAARTSQPDVILMDINLPGISGVEALKVLRRDPATSHIPVVAISANAMPRDIQSSLEAGFFRYLTKPIKVKEFMDTLNAALALAEEVSHLDQVRHGSCHGRRIRYPQRQRPAGRRRRGQCPSASADAERRGIRIHRVDDESTRGLRSFTARTATT